ncbi:hypothetical protein [Phenylobacterium sp.]|jgi:hypothetical protein|uniref:hypothetical protein n=1 Tax=Phenylobacterium sp. TaxID=1871053 RepID=UPI0037CAE4EE
MLKYLIVLSALALAGSAQASSPDDDAPILATVQRFFDALGARDTATMRQIVLPGSIYTAVSTQPDGTTRIGRMAADETFNKAIGPGYLERMWSPVVSRRGAMATVTAPYEFQVDGKTTHCGVDVFGLIKAEAEWKIASFMWTQEPDACAELKATEMRPTPPKAPATRPR